MTVLWGFVVLTGLITGLIVWQEERETRAAKRFQRQWWARRKR